MASRRLGEGLAEAFIAEGVEAVFGLMGDANMRWMTAMADRVRVIHARHEAAAISMADAYAQLTGEVGVASVTCGPGLTQIPTPLTSAVRHRTPMVVFAGDTPRRAPFHVQAVEPGPLVRSTGAVHIGLSDPRLAPSLVAEAFVVAASDRVPVVITVPFDWQDDPIADDWRPVVAPRSTDGSIGPQPDAGLIDRVAATLVAASRPLVLAGRGVVDAEAGAEVAALADDLGALLATTLFAKGLFDGHSADLGVIGGLANRTARKLAEQADVVLALGAGLNGLTTQSGTAFGKATVLHVDLDPARWRDGRATADVTVVADVRAAVPGLRKRIAELRTEVDDSPEPRMIGFRTAEVLDSIEETVSGSVPADGQGESLDPGTVDPRQMVFELNEATPGDAVIIVGGGHFWNFVVPALRDRDPRDLMFTIADLAAIGLALPAGIGAVVARPDQRVVVVEGDGSVLMNIQELETIVRHGLDVCIVVMNDGAYGAEVHKLNAMGLRTDEGIFGPTDLASIARGFGLDAVTVDSDGGTREAIQQWVDEGGPTLIDVKVSPTVVAPSYRRNYFGEDA
ncbi:MAG: thiamine pyrophosphate-binding protein [Nitriliruptoraceae bacterium]